MADPEEGVAPDGTITTGARRDRVPSAFEPVLHDAVERMPTAAASLYVYGSVASGTARLGASDVDLLSVDLPHASTVGDALSRRYAGICRGVEVSALAADDLRGETDAAYGNRVFLRHYCVHLAGPDPSSGLPAFPADARAARGFNGDLGQYLVRWRARLDTQPDRVEELGIRIARKTLLAVAGLVSVHDHTWTTDRARAAERWSEIEPRLSPDLKRLHAWVVAERRPSSDEVRAALTERGAVDTVVERFRDVVGLWAD